MKVATITKNVIMRYFQNNFTFISWNKHVVLISMEFLLQAWNCRIMQDFTNVLGSYILKHGLSFLLP